MVKLLVQCGAIGAAGAVGAVVRFLIGMAAGRLFGADFPIGTFIINITGSLLLGWFLTVAQTRIVISDTTRLAVATGFVGAYTTFSTFMVESNDLLRSGSELKAAANLVGSVLVGLVAVRLGVYLGGR